MPRVTLDDLQFIDESLLDVQERETQAFHIADPDRHIHRYLLDTKPEFIRRIDTARLTKGTSIGGMPGNYLTVNTVTDLTYIQYTVSAMEGDILLICSKANIVTLHIACPDALLLRIATPPIVRQPNWIYSVLPTLRQWCMLSRRQRMLAVMSNKLLRHADQEYPLFAAACQGTQVAPDPEAEHTMTEEQQKILEIQSLYRAYLQLAGMADVAAREERPQEICQQFGDLLEQLAHGLLLENIMTIANLCAMSESAVTRSLNDRRLFSQFSASRGACVISLEQLTELMTHLVCELRDPDSALRVAARDGDLAIIQQQLQALKIKSPTDELAISSLLTRLLRLCSGSVTPVSQELRTTRRIHLNPELLQYADSRPADN
ncbi:MAG: hypothetical protein ACK4SA_15290 [Caldilinea sp.]